MNKPEYFIDLLAQEGTDCEIAYWIGYRVAELQFGERHRLTPEEQKTASVAISGVREDLLEALAKLHYLNPEE